ncbi:dTDP-4-dehydrorhamnose reductase family protein [Vibrio salinus]|uniref:dTDP-4-dehydrorhamnose reductase family protein n=1 Tax=Vibrio salinus TaxID=2899784 RepID=UPI001E5224F1|nr:SDR family oxidoreductase [Vibrio salinus]MCE0493783.1 SDR family oxidoreductase [Vibrio salinus]
MKVLILGATGMLGYSLFSNLSEYDDLEVFGSVRSIEGIEHYYQSNIQKLIFNVDINELDTVNSAIKDITPDVVINCIGIIKQNKVVNEYVTNIQYNALFPHQLADICNSVNAKLIHFSTDCVFDGKKGHYTEADIPTATDLYGKTKQLGEVVYGKHLTIRTSIIGHELKSNVSLIDWFLNAFGSVNGYSNAIFSGFPTCYVAKIIAEHILGNENLYGLMHLSSKPIDKYSLLRLISDTYHKDINIVNYPDFKIDRSMDSSLFQSKTEISIPDWSELIQLMFLDYKKRYLHE